MLNKNIIVDLHIHSKASDYKEERGYMDESNIDNVEVLIGKLEQNNVNLFSITDHNRFDYELYSKLKEKISKNKYTYINNILPGIEFDVNLEENKKPCHIICIFDDKNQKKLSEISSIIKQNRELTLESDFYKLEEFEDIIFNIGLNVLLIAHQKSSLDNEKGDTNSLSECTSEPFSFIKTGYISALEYQKPRVQGMINKSLRDTELKFPTITGTDCHVWKYYPYKDEKNIKNFDYFTKIRCLPTFKGLVLAFTSIDTRFDRVEDIELDKYIHSISINGEEILLSKGINAIIGDNASGKSLILDTMAGKGKSDKDYYNKIIKKNNITVNNIGNPTMNYIKQGSIIKDVKDGNLFKDGNSTLFDDIPTINKFKDSINEFIKKLDLYIRKNIDIEKNKSNIGSCKINISNKVKEKNFYPSINIDIDIPNNIHSIRYTELNNIIQKLKEEFTSQEEYYKNKINCNTDDIIKSLTSILDKIDLNSKKIDVERKLRNMIINTLSEKKVVISKNRTSKEKEKEAYFEKIRKFSKSICDFIKFSELNEYPVFPDKINGKSIKLKFGFKFVKKAKYDEMYLEEELYKSIFNNSYCEKQKIINIKSENEYTTAVRGITEYSNIINQINNSAEKFINENIRDETFVESENMSNEVGSTAGEISLTYYKITLNQHSDSDVLLIDQPEDDISVKRIEEYLIDYFKNTRDKKQIIFVTHNPLLVVNLDVDNLIYLNKNRYNDITCSSGCLEYEFNEKSIIDIVGENLDGGYETIERRLRVYGAGKC